MIDPSLPANENIVDPAFPERCISVRIDSNPRRGA